MSPITVALIEHEPEAIAPFVWASAIAISLGFLCRKMGGGRTNFDRLKRNEGMLIVCLAWLSAAAVTAIPYLFFGLSPLDAYFEAMSGITTTGATILLDFSGYPRCFFFWRSLSQWLGGMGIIVLFVAILPQFKVAGRQLFFAEAPGPTEERVTPRITQTAKALWFVYVSLTLLEIGALVWAGMGPFDAVCNSLSTMAAGGFSPNPASIMGYGSDRICWIITVFMFLAGANFASQYWAFVRRRPRVLFGSEEFRGYLAIIVAAGGGVSAALLATTDASGVVALRDGYFQIVSLLTTTGFATADFARWAVPCQVILFSVMLVGGCAGSAGGGIKVVRILFCAKYIRREIVKIIHPRLVMPIKIDRKTVPEAIQQQILGFLLFYLLVLIASTLVVTAIEHDLVVGIVGTAATLGNIGPGYGEIGPMASFGTLVWPTKLIFIFNMVVGRLEIIPFLAMLHPDFWYLSKH
ncbi:MAG: TrkH family potassium uptake protein [Desulfofustis sp. PB-SRB1]|nr:TrkH family potassium uptake protein [Desulfofustis sp. PB-SRB1]